MADAAPPEVVEVELVARPRLARILPEPAGPTPVATYSDAFPGPVIRMRQGQRLRARLVNGLDEHTSIHWHGLRLPNAEDGVPFLTQAPVPAGATHTYDFVPPDAGSFFFHPHCDTTRLLGRGLAGLLIVEESDGPRFDADLPCMVKDWHLEPDGRIGTVSTDRGAARAGTFGNVATVNGSIDPVIPVPAGGDIRIRLFNVDSSRILDPMLEGAEAWILAVDGIPMTPRRLDGWLAGPATRLDIVFRAPKTGTVRLVNAYASTPRPLAAFRAEGTPLSRGRFRPLPLPAAAIPAPDLARAETLRFDFSATAVARAFAEADLAGLPFADSLCLSEKTFWAINETPWPDAGHERLPPPLAVLERGRTYVLELANLTPHLHPIHLHGHSFLVLGSDKRSLPRHYADTVLLEPRERMRVAFVADNPGDWMLHCHIIEHQETGMMGFLRVA
ncbi:multicopper oxidase family protein [Arenibaculum pallidiluteum]|uniref:multicopper oxidase family protein n=1 Tax=Arenibaculum pallidiluteum TaxID=2812559 RepID=UPI002E2A4A0C|nr:multicopper oxidase family protein [Arenibaculum pallidiluteum]